MAYYAKGIPFAYKGTIDVSDCNTSREVIEKAKLDWEVAKCPLVAKMPGGATLDKQDEISIDDGFFKGSDFYRRIESVYATYRTDLNIPLGVVKDKYTPVQNLDAFKFFDDAIGKNKAIWQTAGYFGNGERIFVTAKLPKNIFVNGDPVENYLVFTTSHDGSSGVKILFTPIRVICENTLNAAIRTSDNYVSYRHTESVKEKLDVAAEILGICDVKIKALEESFNRFAKVKINDKEAAQYFTRLILNDREYDDLKTTGHDGYQLVLRSWDAMNDANISTKKCNVIAEMYYYYLNGIGQEKFRGTGWGAYNAVNGYYSNVDKVDGLKRMDSLLYGDKAKKIKQSADLMLDIAVHQAA